MTGMMEMVFTKEEMNRITEKLKADGRKSITVDLHGLRVREARRFLLNIMALNRQDCEICAIHGYSHGTAIKEMIGQDMGSPRIVSKTGVQGNYGRTVLKVGKAA